VDGRRSPLLGGLTVAIGASLFGMLGPLSRTVYDLGMTPYGFVAWRTGVGALVTGGLVLWRVRRSKAQIVGWRSLDGRGRASLAVACAVGAALNMAMFLAFARVPIAIVLLCFYLYPAIVAAVSSLLGWEPLDRPRAMALVISLGGMVAVVAGGSASAGSGGLDLLGVGLALSAALSQATFVLVSRSGYRAMPTDQAMCAILGASGLIAAVAAVAGGIGGSILLPFTAPPMLGLLLFTGVFAAAIPSNLFLAGIRWIGPVRAGILMLIEPLVGVLLAALLLGESVGPVQVAGGLAILAGAVIIQRARPAEPTIIPAAEPEMGELEAAGAASPVVAPAPAMGADR
jgi:drug/metabolite transporter (DMT)-like permease